MLNNLEIRVFDLSRPIAEIPT